MILRFVRHKWWESTLIALQEKTAMPFTPSHVEALTPDGKFYLGAHLDGGTMKRPVGYDTGKVARLPEGYDQSVFPDGLCDLRLNLQSTVLQNEAFFDFLESHIGTPYDWLSIIGFVVPEHFHLKDHVICSALQVLALRACGWLEWPIARPAHLVSPADLLTIISTRMKVPGI